RPRRRSVGLACARIACSMRVQVAGASSLRTSLENTRPPEMSVEAHITNPRSVMPKHHRLEYSQSQADLATQERRRLRLLPSPVRARAYRYTPWRWHQRTST